MNPWDNLVTAGILLVNTWPAFAFAFGLFFIDWFLSRPKDPSKQFSNEKYEDGFFVQRREKRE